MIKLGRSEREFFRWPVTGTNRPLEISTDNVAWTTLNPDPAPPTPDGQWWRVLLAGPEVDVMNPQVGAHPAGTLIVTDSLMLRGRVVSGVGGEVLEVFKEWVVLLA